MTSKQLISIYLLTQKILGFKEIQLDFDVENNYLKITPIIDELSIFKEIKEEITLEEITDIIKFLDFGIIIQQNQPDNIKLKIYL